MMRRPASLLLAIASLCAFWSAVPSPAVAAEGAWNIVQTSGPTNLVPGSEAEAVPKAWDTAPRWAVFLTNVGDGTAGPVTVTDTLPAGIEVAESVSPTVGMPNGSEIVEEPCAYSGQTVTCELSRPTPPGRQVQIYIPLAINPSASGEIENHVSVSAGTTPTASSEGSATVSSTPARFGFVPRTGLRGVVYGVPGVSSNIAGSHPFLVQVGAEIPTRTIGATGTGVPVPVEGLRTFAFDLPGGLVVNPSAVPVRCKPEALANAPITGVGCPVGSQVGDIFAQLSGIGGTGPYPLYVMEAPPGHPAELAFSYDGVVANVLGGLGGNLHLTAESSDLLTHYPIVGIDAFLWGVPSDAAHDAVRYGEGCRSFFGCEAEAPSPAPFLTMPSSCTEPMELTGSAVSWMESKETITRPVTATDGDPVHVTDCGSLAFEPTFEARATTDAGEHPSGLDVSIRQRQDESLEGRATATLKNVKVTLPEGVTLNAAAANGLSSCTEGQMGFDPGLEPGKVRFDTKPQSCPDAAKVGTVEATTSLLKGAAEETLPGSVYVAQPFENPFGSLLAVYLAIEGRKTGIIAKLAGKVEADPHTGRLAATFAENPDLPLENIDVHFFKGENATVTTPVSCGTKTTEAILTPWSTPEGADANLTDSFGIGTSCSSSEATAPKTNSFSAGTVSPLAGSYSPFVLRIARPDGSQHITGVETTLPEGLLGRLAGVTYCPEPGINQAIGRENHDMGKLEELSPSCPASSEVGTVSVTAGSGSTPISVSGHAYLAGPYKGAPLSLVAIVPAVAGPFDLGTVVDRVALHVGEYDARIHAISDPLATIREGIPVDVRSIELRLDRPGFTLNPTSCEAMAIEGEITTQAGQTAPLNNHFRVGECGRLGFKPSVKISLKGATKRAGHPALKATVTYPKHGEYANIARAQVSLPHAEFLDQGSIAKACTKPVLAARACPSKSIYGKVKAWTPLLEKPLEGPVYLVGGYGYALPALVAELNGQIRVLLVGKVDTDKQHGIRNTFEAVPDAPVEKFVLEMKGGKKYGLLENSENICKKKQLAGAAFKAQNGLMKTFTVKIANSCKRGAKKPKKANSRR